MTAPAMTTPPLLVPIGMTRDANHVYGWNDGRRVYYPMPSVTTILKVVDKSGPLVGWAKRETARCAVDNLETVATIKATAGRDSAINYLKGIPDYQRDTAADLGSSIHRLVEGITKGEDIAVSEAEAPYVETYRRFLKEHKPEFLAVEEMVASIEHNFAGTLDAIARIRGELWLLDTKTGSGIYPEIAMQLAAYGHAEFIGRPGSRTRFLLPKVTRYGVIHVRPDATRLVPYKVDRSTFDAFLDARRLWAWQQERGKAVIEAEIKGEAA